MALAAAGGGPVGLLNGFFGQYSSDRLRDHCDTGIDTITLSFVTSSPENEPSGLPGTNFAGHCWAGTYNNTDGVESDLQSNCYWMKQDIPYCKARGVKILLSIGGESSLTGYSYNVGSDKNGESFADFLYGAFGPYDPTWNGPRPFDIDNDTHTSVDGFDFDIENAYDNHPYIAMINRFRSYDPSLMITGSPQCPLLEPWAYMQDMIQAAAFDRLNVQFYNNPGCNAAPDDALLPIDDGTEITSSLGLSNKFNYDDWERVLAASDSSQGAKIFVGLPASTSAAQNGYLTPEQAKYLICKYKNKPHFGGVSLWDISFGGTNVIDGKTYQEHVLDGLQYGCSAVTTTSASKTSATKTKTTSKSTSKPTTTAMRTTQATTSLLSKTTSSGKVSTRLPTTSRKTTAKTSPYGNMTMPHPTATSRATTSGTTSRYGTGVSARPTTGPFNETPVQPSSTPIYGTGYTSQYGNGTMTLSTGSATTAPSGTSSQYGNTPIGQTAGGSSLLSLKLPSVTLPIASLTLGVDLGLTKSTKPTTTSAVSGSASQSGKGTSAFTTGSVSKSIDSETTEPAIKYSGTSAFTSASVSTRPGNKTTTPTTTYLGTSTFTASVSTRPGYETTELATTYPRTAGTSTSAQDKTSTGSATLSTGTPGDGETISGYPTASQSSGWTTSAKPTTSSMDSLQPVTSTAKTFGTTFPPNYPTTAYNTTSGIASTSSNSRTFASSGLVTGVGSSVFDNVPATSSSSKRPTSTTAVQSSVHDNVPATSSTSERSGSTTAAQSSAYDNLPATSRSKGRLTSTTIQSSAYDDVPATSKSNERLTSTALFTSTSAPGSVKTSSASTSSAGLTSSETSTRSAGTAKSTGAPSSTTGALQTSSTSTGPVKSKSTSGVSSASTRSAGQTSSSAVSSATDTTSSGRVSSTSSTYAAPSTYSTYSTYSSAASSATTSSSQPYESTSTGKTGTPVGGSLSISSTSFASSGSASHTTGPSSTVPATIVYQSASSASRIGAAPSASFGIPINSSNGTYVMPTSKSASTKSATSSGYASTAATDLASTLTSLGSTKSGTTAPPNLASPSPAITLGADLGLELPLLGSLTDAAPSAKETSVSMRPTSTPTNFAKPSATDSPAASPNLSLTAGLGLNLPLLGSSLLPTDSATATSEPAKTSPANAASGSATQPAGLNPSITLGAGISLGLPLLGSSQVPGAAGPTANLAVTGGGKLGGVTLGAGVSLGLPILGSPTQLRNSAGMPIGTTTTTVHLKTVTHPGLAGVTAGPQGWNTTDTVTASTVYTTKVYTITKCAPTVTDCPVGKVTTETLPLYSTTVPVTRVAGVATPVITEAAQMTTSTVFTTQLHTITSCAPEVTNCPVGQVVTRTVALYTTICPVTATATPAGAGPAGTPAGPAPPAMTASARISGAPVPGSSGLWTAVRPSTVGPQPSAGLPAPPVANAQSVPSSPNAASSGSGKPNTPGVPPAPGAGVPPVGGAPGEVPVGAPPSRPSIPVTAGASILGASLAGLAAVMAIHVL